jgi:hypothetical protein
MAHCPPHDFGHHSVVRGSSGAPGGGAQSVHAHSKEYVARNSALRMSLETVVSMYAVVICASASISMLARSVRGVRSPPRQALYP